MKVCKDSARAGLRRQSGAHAVEYAIVFPVFFMLLYGTLAYGLIFVMRLGLQNAAESGARAALRYPVGATSQITAREAAAEATALNAARWINDLGSLRIVADICPLSTDCLAVSGVEQADNIPCGKTLDDGCQVVVTVEFPYATHPIFPALPGLGLIMPARLQGRARAVLDGRALAL